MTGFRTAARSSPVHAGQDWRSEMSDVYEHPALTALIAKRMAREAARAAVPKVAAPVATCKGDKEARHVVNSHMDQLQEELRKLGLMVVPMEPTDGMVAASMATVTGRVGIMGKEEKHRRRLQAALTAHALKTGGIS